MVGSIGLRVENPMNLIQELDKWLADSEKQLENLPMGAIVARTQLAAYIESIKKFKEMLNDATFPSCESCPLDIDDPKLLNPPSTCYIVRHWIPSKCPKDIWFNKVFGVGGRGRGDSEGKGGVGNE